MRSSAMGKVMLRVNMSDCGKMPIRFGSPIFSSIALLAYGATNEHLADLVIPAHLC